MTSRWVGIMALTASCITGLFACHSGDSDTTALNSILQVVSNRSDLVSGGDVLVDVVPPDGNLSGVQVTLNGEDITTQFKPYGKDRLRGLVTNLSLGENLLATRMAGAAAQTTVNNHPNGGPVFSGPQLQPWTCRNEAATDAHCNQPTEYSFWYKSTDQQKSGFQPYDLANPPTDVATTTTESGETLPFIVRQELGYQDRDQYRIAALFRPDQNWTATQPQKQFNHKLLINHGASCGVDYETAGAPAVIPGTPSVPVVDVELPFPSPIPLVTDATELALGKGFVVMSTALNNSGHNCNLALQAESLVMAKERVIEQYGDLRYTIGEGCSGGSLTMHWVANAYPGIYQGILPTCSFPDAWSTATQFADYHVLLAYFTDPSKWGAGLVWSPTQMADVQGHVTIANSEVSDQAQFHVAYPDDACDGVSEAQRYDAVNNPGGVRCSIQDAAINLLGLRPPELWGAAEKKIGRGFAGFPVDNVGVQYGLAVLQAGTITPAQFLDLNEKIGGLNEDTQPIPNRVSAVQPALTNAYRSGLINEANHLDQTAIIDCRGPDPGAFHDSYRAFALRARLDRAHGDHDNQMIWQGPILIIGDNDCARNSFVAMDRWLTAVESNPSTAPLAERLVTFKPADLKDACFDGVGQKLTDGLCPATPTVAGVPSSSVGVVPVYGTPRTIAGDSIATDTNKCQLKPLNRSDQYGPIGFSDGEWVRMQALFPSGVCDYSKPGVSQQGAIAWQSYQKADGSVIYGGTALPAAPAGSGTGWSSERFARFGE